MPGYGDGLMTRGSRLPAYGPGAAIDTDPDASQQRLKKRSRKLRQRSRKALKGGTLARLPRLSTSKRPRLRRPFMLAFLAQGSPLALAVLSGCPVLVLIFEFSNGFHDTVNAVATVIYTNSLKPGYAVVWSGLMNFLGVLRGASQSLMRWWSSFLPRCFHRLTGALRRGCSPPSSSRHWSGMLERGGLGYRIPARMR